MLTIISELFEVLWHSLVEFARLFDKNLLYTEKVPVFADRLQEVVEKVIEFNSEVIPNEDDMVAQLNLVYSDVLWNLLSNLMLSVLNLS